MVNSNKGIGRAAEALRSQRTRTVKNCRHCGREMKALSYQHYCSTECRYGRLNIKRLKERERVRKQQTAGEV